MKQTKCVQCGKFMGLNIGLGHFNNGGEHRKTKNGEWACSDRCARDYNMALSLGGNSQSSSQKQFDPEAIASSKANEAASKAEQARIDLEKERHDDEMSLKRRQQELEEKKNRQRRADELRLQGKTKQAFFVEHGQAVGIGVLVLIIGLFFGYQELTSKSNSKEGAEINLKLESIEDQIKLAIQDGNREKALELTNQLVHPLHEKWEEQSKFDTWKGYPFYDDWWSKKRQEYKDQIMAMGAKPEPKEAEVKIEEQPIVEEINNEVPTENTSEIDSTKN
jgi:hypothetical protein